MLFPTITFSHDNLIVPTAALFIAERKRPHIARAIKNTLHFTCPRIRSCFKCRAYILKVKRHRTLAIQKDSFSLM